MNRRELIRNAVLSAGALGAGAISESQEGKGPQKRAAANRDLAGSRGIPGSPKRAGDGPTPNILWVCTDQQRFDTLQGLSNDLIHTPNLAKFIGESTAFTNVFAQTPICSPSRGSFLTGRYPHSTGLRANGQFIRTSELLVPRLLRDNGYTCGLSGKLHLEPCDGFLETEERIDDGYSLFEWSHDLSAGGPDHNAWLVWLRKQGITLPKPPKGQGPAWGMPLDPKYTQTAWCCDVAMDFMRTNKGKPWLMSVNIFQPHHPFYPTEEYLAKYDPKKMPDVAYREGELDNKTPFQQIDHHGAYGGRDISFVKQSKEERLAIKAAYYAMIEQVDTSFGKMMQVLEETGQADNTIVIFMSDHGEMLGDHGLYLKGPFFYDCLTRVPLVIRWPKHFKAGKKVDALVELIDLAPTLVEACGVPKVLGMQGQSLMPLLTTDETKHRDSVFTEYYNANFQYPTDFPPMLTSVRTTDWKLNYCDHGKFAELYDLKNDPGEFNNVWNDPHARDTRDQMMQALLTRMIDTLDPLPAGVSNW